jgi:hypothetical protein
MGGPTAVKSSSRADGVLITPRSPRGIGSLISRREIRFTSVRMAGRSTGVTAWHATTRTLCRNVVVPAVTPLQPSEADARIVVGVAGGVGVTLVLADLHRVGPAIGPACGPTRPWHRGQRTSSVPAAPGRGGGVTRGPVDRASRERRGRRPAAPQTLPHGTLARPGVGSSIRTPEKIPTSSWKSACRLRSHRNSSLA